MRIVWSFLSFFMVFSSFGNFQSRAEAVNAFALDLYQQLSATSSDNFFFSPYSFSEAFSICALGARGKTLEEMNSVFYFQSKALFKLRSDLKKAKGVTLHVANGIWVDSHFELLPEFQKKAHEEALAEVKSIDFQKSAEKARKEINQWVEQQTQNKIRDLLPPNAVKSITKLIIANAIYFLGKWDEPFKARSFEEPFYGEGGKETKAIYFSDKRTLPYAEKEGIKVVQLDYLGKRFSMLVLLPENSKNSLANLEKKLSTEWLESLIDGQLKPTKVSFRMPRFKQEFTLMANDTLKQMGLTTAFDEKLANFSGLAKEPLYISDVIHKAFVEVNEQGTEAAAATAIVGPTSARYDPTPIKLFEADRPFVYAIRENSTGAFLFMGRCMKP